MKTYKKIAILVLSLVMISLSGCSALKSGPKVEINHKIVGKWSSKNIAGTDLITDFRKDGTASVYKDGKEITSQKYKLLDETTLETETKQGAKFEVKIEFSNNDNTMMVTDFTKQKTPYTRQ